MDFYSILYIFQILHFFPWAKDVFKFCIGLFFLPKFPWTQVCSRLYVYPFFKFTRPMIIPCPTPFPDSNVFFEFSNRFKLIKQENMHAFLFCTLCLNFLKDWSPEDFILWLWSQLTWKLSCRNMFCIELDTYIKRKKKLHR